MHKNTRLHNTQKYKYTSKTLVYLLLSLHTINVIKLYYTFCYMLSKKVQFSYLFLFINTFFTYSKSHLLKTSIVKYK